VDANSHHETLGTANEITNGKRTTSGNFHQNYYNFFVGGRGGKRELLIECASRRTYQRASKTKVR